ncbi:MAG: hypothetical protein AB7F19_04165 [Candidatus Babeliales bacterium]
MQKLLITLPDNFKTYTIDEYVGKIGYLGYFLNDIRLHSIPTFTKWALNPHEFITGTNSAWLEKKNNFILIGSLFADEPDGGAFFKISIDQFIKLLQEWQKLVESKTKKITIIQSDDGTMTIAGE